MIGKTLTFVAAASTLLIVSTLPSMAEPTAPSGAGARRSSRAAWPKWYYYDQLGLREWHKGNKQRAIDYFDQSFKMAESAIQGKKALDNDTKRMITDVINHQQFHMTVWRTPDPNQARNMSSKELVTRGFTFSDAERERHLRLIDRVEAFAKRALGPKHLSVQAIERHRHYLTPQMEEDAVVNTRGKAAKRGVVERPKWYTNNERDFTPEMFTREPRKVHQEGTEEQKKMDVTKVPNVKVEKGFTYVAGKKINLSKPIVMDKGWAGSSTVGSVERNDPNMPPAGWGAQGAANISDQKATGGTKWGIGMQEQSSGGNQVKRNKWGAGGQEQDSLFNKPWGAGTSQAANDEQNKNP